MAKNTYSIFLETEKGLLSIPCGKLEDIDNYTKRFKNRNEFLTILIKMLKLPLKVSEIGRVSVSTQYRKDYEFDYEKCLPILYNGDNYNIDSLALYFADYLKKDRDRLKAFKNVHLVIDSYDSGRYLDSSIEFFARVYLNKRYRNHREMYSLLSYDYDISKKKFPDREKELKLIPKIKVDDIAESLVQLSSQNKERFEIIFDEISRMDLEELSLLLGGDTSAFVEGVSDLSSPNKKDIEGIQNITGISLEELQSSCAFQINKRHKR